MYQVHPISSASEHPTSFFCTSMFEAGNLPVVFKNPEIHSNNKQHQTTSNNQYVCVCVPENRAPVVHDHFPHSNMVSPIFKHIHPISRPKISTAHRTSSQSLPGQSGPCSKAHLIGQGPSASWAVLLACCNQYHNCRKWMDMVENGNLFKNTHITHIYDKVSGTRICCLIQSTKR